MDELLPCPWCGNTAFVSVYEVPNPNYGGTWWRAGCKGCGVSFPHNFQRDAAVREWNTRSGAEWVVDDAMIDRAADAWFANQRHDCPAGKYSHSGTPYIAMRAALLAAMGGRSEPFEKCGTCGDEIREGEPHRYSSGGLTCWRCLKKSLPPPPTTISEERTR